MNFIHSSNKISLFDSGRRLLAEVTFPDIDDNTVDINHTFVDDSLRGQGIAGQLMYEAAIKLRREHKKAVLSCSYASAWFHKHREEFADVLKED